jgi:DNA (cytosine-5)-methyltransferase 1
MPGMKAITFGSVCSGIEAASVAWHPIGWRASWLSEIEPFPSAVLAHHYPNVPNLGDMTKIAARVASGELHAPDVLVGGTPCQAFSVAGLRKGLSDARGQLTLSYVHLANAIDSARSVRGEQPAVLVWENVPGVLNSADNAFGCFLGALAGEDCELVPSGRKWSNAGCVYGPERTVAWRIIDAQYSGVAQRRRRVFVVASARKGFDPSTVLFEFDGVRRDTAPRRDARQGAAGTAANGAGAGDSVVCVFDPNQVTNVHNRSKPTPELAHTLPASVKPPVAYSVALRGREGGATAELGGDIAGCLRASTGGGDKPHVLSSMAVRRLTPIECERLQGFPDGYTAILVRGKPAADGPRYKALGNSMAVPVMAWIGRRIYAALT